MYETDASTAGAALSTSGSVVFTDDTISQILSLSTSDNDTIQFDQLTPTDGSTVTVAAGTDIAFFSSSNTDQANFVVQTDAPVLIFQGSAGVDVVISGDGTGSGTERMVVGTAGNDSIVIADNTNTQIILGSGQSTVVAGMGDDTIVAGLGNSTVDGGGGHDIVQVQGNSSDYAVVVSGTPQSAGAGHPQADGTSHVVITNKVTGVTTDITGVQYVALDNNDAIIFAESTVEAGVSSLYHAAFGRTAEAGGIQFWFDMAKQGVSLHDMAVAFTQSGEFAAEAAMSDTDFITALYQNTFNRAPDAGGLAYWIQQVSNGVSRADLLTAFASVAAQNQDGVLHTEATVVGTVTIVPHIV
jgi:Ca2+-binding RTX toxin-like protein